MRSKANRRKINHDSKIKAVQFNVGDQVLVRTHPQSSSQDSTIRKLFLLYEGPYTVLSSAGPNSYIISDDRKTKQNIVNLKLYKSLDISKI